MARYATRKRKLLEQALQALFVLRDLRIELAVRSLEIRVGDDARAAMPRSGYEDHVEVMRLDDAIQVNVDEIESRRGTPVPKEPRLDVIRRQRLLQQRIVVEVDLSDRQ